MEKRELTAEMLMDLTVRGKALNILDRAMKGEAISQAEQDFFHDWKFETSTPEFFKYVKQYADAGVREVLDELAGGRR